MGSAIAGAMAGADRWALADAGAVRGRAVVEVQGSGIRQAGRAAACDGGDAARLHAAILAAAGRVTAEAAA